MADSGETRDPVFNRIIKDGEAGSISKWVSTLMGFATILGVIGVATIFWWILKSALSK